MYIKSRNIRALRGFTLTEILVAVALLVVIMLSVSTIFRATSQTVSAGIATTDIIRRVSAAQASLRTDFVGAGHDDVRTGAMLPVDAAASYPPFLMITSFRQYGFMNKQQWIAEGSPPAAPIDAAHAYHQDLLGFFTSTTGNWKRQTGGRQGGVVETQTPQTANLAYIWYGHLWLPGSGDPLVDATWYIGGSPAWPGTGSPVTNPNNYFANQWILGRVALEMFTPSDITNPSSGITSYSAIQATPLDYSYVTYYGRDPASASVITNLSPLGIVSDGTWLSGTPTYYSFDQVWRSRYDAIGTYYDTAAAKLFSWDDYANLFVTRRDPLGAGYNTAASNQFTASAQLSYRFRGIPNPDVYAGTTAAQFAELLAKNVPAFLPSCARFKVDFAGDFISQVPATGLVNVAYTPKLNQGFDATDYAAPLTDGVIDFNIDPLTGARSIRWYGLPDDPAMPIPNPAALAAPGDLGRSIPVAPVFYSRGNGAAAATHQWMPFEEASPNHPVNPSIDQYICSWSPREMHPNGWAVAPTANQFAPQLIRITIQFVDANGRVQDGMTQQYVFPVRFL